MNKKTSPSLPTADTENMHDSSEPAQSQPASQPDPTARWSERVKQMTSGYVHHPANGTATEAQHAQRCPLRDMDIQTVADCAEKYIVKRPLTSMVIAATAGAVVTALFAALIGSSKRRH